MVTDHSSTRESIRELSRVFQVSERPFDELTVTNKSISLTHTVASSLGCTYLLAVITVVRFMDTHTVSSSSEFKFFSAQHVH